MIFSARQVGQAVVGTPRHPVARFPWAGWLLVLSGWLAYPVWGQPATDSSAADPLLQAQQQIERLGHPNYRTRQMARARLEENPQPALQAIRQAIQDVDSMIGTQLVDLLSSLALHTDLIISRSATETLTSLANQATSVGRSATNSLSAIADLQEEKAVEILTNQGAYIGPQNFSINGRLDQALGPLALRIDDGFWGSDTDLEWIRYLKSVRVVYFRGGKITPTALQAVSQLKELRAIKLHGVSLTPEQLLQFQELSVLEHLGLSYMKVDDSFVPSILQLPISQSIRLYGTRISRQGEQQLVEQFDGVEIFRGAGGFLGVSSIRSQPLVDRVTPGSAAALAGILSGDTIVAVNGAAVATFEQLRAELGKYEAGETVEILLQRPVQRPAQDPPREGFGLLEFAVKATLQEEEAP